MINSFWWGTKKEGERGMSWLSWDQLFVHKNLVEWVFVTSRVSI